MEASMSHHKQRVQELEDA
jgi:chromosome segregation ATPase